MRLFRLILCFSVILTISNVAFAQKNHAADADRMFDNRGYHGAIDMYKKALTKTNKPAEKARIIFQIAESYRLTLDYKQAEMWYEKAIKAKYPDPEAILRLADMKKEQGNFAEALSEYNNYKQKVPDDPRGDRGAKSCELAQEWKDNPSRYIVDNEVLLNSPQYDFALTFADKRQNEVIFTSTREGTTSSEIDESIGQNFSDLWTASRDKKGKWSEPVRLAAPINTESNEGSATFDRKYKEMYFTRCPVEKKERKGCDIYVSSQQGPNWMEPEKIKIKPEGDDSSTVGHPALTPRDDALIFASDMPGGHGGRDLWMIKYDRREKAWGEPINLGPEINTEKDEMFPYIHEDGTLYFSSNGHLGMGGLDIFKAELVDEDEFKWSNVENMKFPINSAGHDFGIVFERGEDRGFLTSNRAGGKGFDDIYNFRMPELKVVLEVNVINKETNEPVPGAKISLAGTEGDSYEVETDENGVFVFDEVSSYERYLELESTYSLKIEKEDYLVYNDNVTTVGIKESTKFIREYFIQPTKIEDEVIEIDFPEVRYAYNKAELLVEDGVNSKDSLNYLYQTLMDNPTIIIELQAHTDCRGSASYNKELSQRRAQSCVEYLKSKGIPAERMKAKGYGLEKPRDGLECDAIKKLPTEEEQEAAHAKNRRTQFIVLSWDYRPPEEPEED